MPDTTTSHTPIPSPAPCLPDHGVPEFCWGCAAVCAVCRDEHGDPVLWPCEHAGESDAPMPEGRTVDYTRRGWGHSYEILHAHDGGQRLKAAGWGPFMGAQLKRGDYVLLIGKTPDSSTRYQVDEVEYRMDPRDMWFATLLFAPRQHAVAIDKEEAS